MTSAAGTAFGQGSAASVIDVHSHWMPTGYAEVSRRERAACFAGSSSVAALSSLSPNELLTSLDARLAETDDAAVDVSRTARPHDRDRHGHRDADR
jgi:hypothetical protein